MDFEFEKINSSGQGARTSVPQEIKGWNWGAFFLNWIWGIGNSTYIALLMFVPLVNFVMPFVLGAKGNQWAWQNRNWQSVEQFKRVQRRWAFSGLVLILVVLPAIFFLVTSAMKESEAFRLSLSAIKNNPEVIELLGEPIEAGTFVTGKIRTGIGTGAASISYHISGPKGEAVAYVQAVKEAGPWDLVKLVVYSESAQKKIIIIERMPSQSESTQTI